MSGVKMNLSQRYFIHKKKLYCKVNAYNCKIFCLLLITKRSFIHKRLQYIFQLICLVIGWWALASKCSINKIFGISNMTSVV